VSRPHGPTEPPAWPAISVIVPVHNGGRQLARLVQSLERCEYPGPPPEIVIVDNNSTDGAVAALAGRRVRRLAESKPGAPCARNAGARAAAGEILVFTDHDCLAERRWLRELAEAFRDPDVPAAAGETLPMPAVSPAAEYLAMIRHNSAEASLARPVFPFAATANLAVRRSVFTALGGFDESLPHTDDADFSLRLRRETGRPIRFVRTAIVFHDERTSAAAIAHRYRQYGEGWARLVMKHPGELAWGAHRGLAATLDVVRALAFVPVGWLKSRLGGRPMDFWYRWFEFVRRAAHRDGFAAEARRHGHWFW
jgi:GT2 family glycosyltransferase